MIFDIPDLYIGITIGVAICIGLKILKTKMENVGEWQQQQQVIVK